MPTVGISLLRSKQLINKHYCAAVVDLESVLNVDKAICVCDKAPLNDTRAVKFRGEEDR